jgi:hypothetical protein
LRLAQALNNRRSRCPRQSDAANRDIALPEATRPLAPPRGRRKARLVPRLLFITSNRIGDAVLSTAALEEAMARLPGASVVIACGELPAPLFRATPGLERIVTFRKERGRWMKLWRSALLALENTSPASRD